MLHKVLTQSYNPVPIDAKCVFINNILMHKIEAMVQYVRRELSSL